MVFLGISTMQQFPSLSPTGRHTTIVPLLVILTYSAIKEIYEDIKRWIADKKINRAKVLCFHGVDQWKAVESRHLSVGDVVRINNNQSFPADIILLATSEPSAIAYIETANLDGETNLKLRQGIEDNIYDNDSELAELNATIECDNPSPDLYEFSGTLHKGTTLQSATLNSAQLLMRGAMLRNTLWVVGVVMFTGYDSKIMLNTRSPRIKRSNVDKLSNFLILILSGLAMKCALIATLIQQYLDVGNVFIHYTILRESRDLKAEAEFMMNYASFMITLSSLIPISLSVTLEMVRICQALFINYDNEMFDRGTEKFAIARNSALNEELGQIKYLMTDKTGTLTQNIMALKQVAVGTNVYGQANAKSRSFSDEKLIKKLTSVEASKDHLLEHHLFCAMAVCHTVVPEIDPDKPNQVCGYHASSPDEAALVRGAANVGYKFWGRTPSMITYHLNDAEKSVQLLHVFEFNSVRKRMSVIVRDTDTNQIYVYTKGADTTMFNILRENCPFRSEIGVALQNFAMSGWIAYVGGYWGHSRNLGLSLV